MTNDFDEILTLQEMRKMLGIGTSTALKLLNHGEIRARKVGRQWRILRGSVIEYLNETQNEK